MDAGLLLKYSRGHDIFPSSDIDFGIKSDDIKKLVLFSEFIKNKNYLVKTLGNTSVIFEGVTIVKKIQDDKFVSIDIYVYYPLGNYYCRPNSHKPLKQSNLSKNLFRVFNKMNTIINSDIFKGKYFVKIISKNIFYIFAKIYFRVAITSQFAIPKILFKNFRNIKIYGQMVSIPNNNNKYMEWRYGPNWKITNKNWRLTDGNMVFLYNLRKYWNNFNKAPDFSPSKFLLQKNKSNQKSIFKFDEEELKIIKQSKIKSELIKDNLR